jgi:hypothetical protein
MKKEYLLHLYYWIILAVIFIADLIYKGPLFDASIQSIIDIQENLTEGGRIFFQSLSSMGGGPVYFGAVLLVFGYGRRGHAFYYALYNSVNLFFINFGKAVYHSPRPFMTQIEI